MATARKQETRAQEFDEVAKNKIWKEHCVREAQAQTFNERFAISNPQQIRLLAEKPNAQVPQALGMKGAGLEDALQTLHRVCYTDKLGQTQQALAKDHLPSTTTQFYGVHPLPLLQPHKMFDNRKQHTDATDFAAVFAIATGGLSPFVKARQLDKNGQPVKLDRPKQY